MIRLKMFALLSLLLFSFASNNAAAANCTFKGIRLYGKVKVVTAFADIKVKVVDSFPDLKVKKVNAFADSCGEWKMVDSFPDFTIQLVDSFPDISIKYVDSFPGE